MELNPGLNTFLTPLVPILITRKGDGTARWGRAEDLSNGYMNDLIFIGIVVVFFVVSGLYVRFCEKL